MSRGKPKTPNALTNLGLSSGSKLPKAQVNPHLSLGPFNHVLFSTSGCDDGETETRGVVEALEAGPSCNGSALPRRAHTTASRTAAPSWERG